MHAATETHEALAAPRDAGSFLLARTHALNGTVRKLLADLNTFRKQLKRILREVTAK